MLADDDDEMPRLVTQQGWAASSMRKPRTGSSERTKSAEVVLRPNVWTQHLVIGLTSLFSAISGLAECFVVGWQYREQKETPEYQMQRRNFRNYDAAGARRRGISDYCYGVLRSGTESK
jgi:hypothetical protein